MPCKKIVNVPVVGLVQHWEGYFPAVLVSVSRRSGQR